MAIMGNKWLDMVFVFAEISNLHMRLLSEARQKRVYILINRKIVFRFVYSLYMSTANSRMRLFFIGTILFHHILQNSASNSTRRQDKFLRKGFKKIGDFS